jgi:molybdopterin converting factor small subunit
MFVDKKTTAMLFEEINMEEIKKKSNKLESTVDLVLFQKRFANLRNFLTKTKLNLEDLFGVQIDFLKNNYENESFDLSEFHMPKLNTEIIVNDNNIYVLMIETIIAYESIHSVYKIIKRLKHFTRVNLLIKFLDH